MARKVNCKYYFIRACNCDMLQLASEDSHKRDRWVGVKKEATLFSTKQELMFLYGDKIPALLTPTCDKFRDVYHERHGVTRDKHRGMFLASKKILTKAWGATRERGMGAPYSLFFNHDTEVKGKTRGDSWSDVIVTGKEGRDFITIVQPTMTLEEFQNET